MTLSGTPPYGLAILDEEQRISGVCDNDDMVDEEVVQELYGSIDRAVPDTLGGWVQEDDVVTISLLRQPPNRKILSSYIRLFLKEHSLKARIQYVRGHIGVAATLKLRLSNRPASPERTKPASPGQSPSQSPEQEATKIEAPECTSPVTSER